MSQIQIKRLSDAKAIIQKSIVGEVMPVLFLDAAAYEDVAPQLDNKPEEDGNLKIKLPGGETKVINEKTVIIIDDIE